MRSLTKLLLIGISIATAFCFGYLFGKNNWHSTSWPQLAAESISTPAPFSAPASDHASASSDFPATLVQPVQLQKTNDPLVEVGSLIHSKLRQLQESEARNPDDIEGRAKLLQEMLAMVTDGNVAEIIKSLSAEEMNTSFGTDALHHWMKVDAVAASNWLASRSETTQEQTIAAAEDWDKNPDDLNQYLDGLPDSAWKQNFIQAASSDMTFKDPIAAVNLAEKMNPGVEQVNVLRAVANGWVSTDPNAALAWVAGVNDPALREQLIASAVQSYALTDPAQAATWLVSEVKSYGIVKETALNILSTWVATDPAAAAGWASSFPEGDLRAAAVKIVSNHWQQTDPAAATAWIQSLPGAIPAN